MTDEAVKKLHMDYSDKLNNSEINRKKDRRFLSLWIHNMKTPLSVTDLLIQRMEREEIDKTAGIQAIKEENQKLFKNLDTVLNMIRMEEFAKDYVPEQINLISEITSIINKNKSLFINNHVFPKIVTDLKEADILSDRKWNELMINQIISNAVKYSRDEDGLQKISILLLKWPAAKLPLPLKMKESEFRNMILERSARRFSRGTMAERVISPAGSDYISAMKYANFWDIPCRFLLSL
jgi:signal transduction histidine kinase